MKFFSSSQTHVNGGCVHFNDKKHIALVHGISQSTLFSDFLVGEKAPYHRKSLKELFEGVSLNRKRHLSIGIGIEA